MKSQHTAKLLNVNEGKIRSHWDQKGADIWKLDYSGNDGGTNAFEQLTFDKMRPVGAWPFDCQKIIPCNGFEGQTCGCSDNDGTNTKSIVYYLGSGSKMNAKLDFKSCQDLQDNGNIYDGQFNIDGQNKYCKSPWDGDCGRGFKRIDTTLSGIDS